MTNPNYVRISRDSWCPIGKVDPTAINTGSLQRIAKALEGIEKHLQYIADPALKEKEQREDRELEEHMKRSRVYDSHCVNASHRIKSEVDYSSLDKPMRTIVSEAFGIAAIQAMYPIETPASELEALTAEKWLKMIKETDYRIGRFGPKKKVLLKEALDKLGW